MTTASNTGDRAGALSAATPVAAAIGVFGIMYGAAASAVIGGWLTVVSSLILFSGAAQFTMIALVAAGAGPAAIVGATATLAIRHLPLGAVLRPRLTAGRGHRALLSLVLTDETTGLALTRGEPPERTIAVSGALAYAAWVAGTGAGVAGGSVASLEPLAAALFPVLFVGLAALTATTRGDGGRALLAGGVSVGLLLVWPDAGALGALAVAIVVATVVRSR